MYEGASRSLNGHAVGPNGPEGTGARVLSAPAPGNGAERRRHARHEVVCEQLVPIQLGSNNGGVVVDLSVGGAAVSSTEPLERSARSSFTVQFGDPILQIDGTGVFVWVDSTGLNGGLRFDRLSPDKQSLLERWLSERMETQYAPELSAEPEAALPPELGAELAVVLELELSAEPAGEPAPEPIAEAATTPVELAAATTITPEPIESGLADAPESDKLQRLAERARRVALAHGACIALKGDEGFACEASVGAAPVVGVVVNEERGLAAECIAGRHLVVCNDAARDPRVSLDSRRHLSLGSAIFLPLCRGNELTGLLGVFSDRCDAFGAQTIARLQDAARLIEASLFGRPAEKSRDNRASEHVAQEYRATTATINGVHVQGLAASTARVLMISLVAAAVLLGVLYLYQLRLAPTPQPRQAPLVSADFKPPQLAQPVPPAIVPAPATEKQAAVVPRERPAPAPEPEVIIRTVKPVETTPVAHTKAGDTAVGTAEKTSAPNPVARAAQAASTNPQPSGTAFQAAASAATPAPPTVRPAPASVRPAPAQPIGHVQILTELLRPKPDVKTQNVVPELSFKVDISYPAAALLGQRQGSVILKVTADEGGNVRNVQVLDGDDTLAAEAVRAVRQWRYKPYPVAGHPVGTELLLTVNFILSK